MTSCVDEEESSQLQNLFTAVMHFYLNHDILLFSRHKTRGQAKFLRNSLHACRNECY